MYIITAIFNDNNTGGECDVGSLNEQCTFAHVQVISLLEVHVIHTRKLKMKRL